MDDPTNNGSLDRLSGGPGVLGSRELGLIAVIRISPMIAVYHPDLPRPSVPPIAFGSGLEKKIGLFEGDSA